MRWILILLALSALTHFVFFGYPNEIVFDEVHFGKFISGYFTGEYFFDIHPPLGKLLISATGYLGGFQPGFSFASIGEVFPDNTYMWLRLLPTLAGLLLPIIIYLIARKLNFSKLSAFCAGIFVILENSILVQSKFMLLDSMLLLFGFLGILLYLIYKDKKKLYLLILSVVSLTFAFSIKWTGASFILLVLIYEIISNVLSRANLKHWATNLATFILIPLIVYSAIFWVHFTLLPRSGQGDAFMSPAFQKTLENNIYSSDPAIKPIGIIKKFTELNIQMYKANQSLSATHSYSSKWYTWPFMDRSVYYWNKQTDNGMGRIYFQGNPFIYWFSFFAVVVLIYQMLSGAIKDKEKKKISLLLSGGFLINLLPFIFIGRVMFLYHYMSALIFGILILAFLTDHIKKRKKARLTFAILTAIFAISFVYFSPLTYGRPLTENQYNSRVWFSSWR